MRAIGIRRGMVLVVLGVVCAISAPISQAAASALPLGGVQRIDVTPGGGIPNAGTELGFDCSADGRYVVFCTTASDILPGDTNGAVDIFWRDTKLGVTKLVDANTSGGFTTLGAPNWVQMTPDGRYVVFTTFDGTVVPHDTNGYADVFRRDMVSNETTLVSCAPDGTQGDYNSEFGTISDDGRYVAMGPVQASNLVPGVSYTNGSTQACVVKDLQSGETTCVSMGYDGSMANGHSWFPQISGDGKKVMFESYATNIVEGDLVGGSVVSLFIRDLSTGLAERVDCRPDGSESSPLGPDFDFYALDYTGRHAVFTSQQKDLVAGSVGSGSQVFLRDTVSHITTTVATTLTGAVPDGYAARPYISNDGRYVQFASAADNLVAGDTNASADVFVRDMTATATVRVSLNESGAELDQSSLENALSGDGSTAVFLTTASNILPPRGTYASHLYERAFRSDDATPPTVQSDAVLHYDDAAHISITATDGPAGSGVKAIRWQLDDAATHTVDDVRATVDAGPGAHTLRFLAEDNAGNVSSVQSASFQVSAETTLSIASHSMTLSAFGQVYALTGTLRAEGVGLAEKRIRLQVKSAGTDWRYVGVQATTTAGGSFALPYAPVSAVQLRAVYEGSAAYDSAVSTTSVAVVPVAWVGKPACGKTSWSHRKSYTVSGLLKPQHAVGSKSVRIYKYRLVGKVWKPYGYVQAKVANSGADSKYSASVKLTTAGKWRLRAYAPADAGHAAAWSTAYLSIAVK